MSKIILLIGLFSTWITLSPPVWSAPRLAETGLLPGTQVVDLTHPLKPGIPFFPGGVPFQSESVARLEKDGYYANRLITGEHTGTHMDAPAHFVKGRWAVNQIPPEHFFAPLVVIDVRTRVQANPDYQLGVPDLQEWERRNGLIPKGAVVVMWTGWDTRWKEADRYQNKDPRGTLHFPGFSLPSAEFLLTQREIVGIGIDTLSLDYGPSHDFSVHRKVLGANKYMLENLTNLDKVPARGAVLVVLPLNISNGSGSPVRALALVNLLGSNR